MTIRRTSTLHDPIRGGDTWRHQLRMLFASLGLSLLVGLVIELAVVWTNTLARLILGRGEASRIKLGGAPLRRGSAMYGVLLMGWWVREDACHSRAPRRDLRRA